MDTNLRNFFNFDFDSHVILEQIDQSNQKLNKENIKRSYKRKSCEMTSAETLSQNLHQENIKPCNKKT